MRTSLAYGSNQLLENLPEDTLERWVPHLTPVELQVGQILYEAGSNLRYAYFPTSSVMALVHMLKDGSMAEIAVVGSEGVVGIPLFLGSNTALDRWVVQGSGIALRLPAAVVQHEDENSHRATRAVLPFVLAVMVQAAQTAACNRHHTIEQQLCRWLLLSLDRAGRDELVMTHELIANMLGVRREGVTAAAARLQRAGIIRYSRGHITLLDRDGLRNCACECYETITGEYKRLRLMPG
jgi:CRP-like cAMP-binding protein